MYLTPLNLFIAEIESFVTAIIKAKHITWSARPPPRINVSEQLQTRASVPTALGWTMYGRTSS